MEIITLYTIKKPNSLIDDYSTNLTFVKEKSKQGYTITAKMYKVL